MDVPVVVVSDCSVVLGEAGEDVELSLWFDVGVEADGTDDEGVEESIVNSTCIFSTFLFISSF